MRRGWYFGLVAMMVWIVGCEDAGDPVEDTSTPPDAALEDTSTATDSSVETDSSEAADSSETADSTDVAAETSDGTNTSTEPTCDAYCGAFVAPCTGAAAPYPDTPTCLTYCQVGQIPAGAFNDLAGNTIGCRISRAGLAERTADPNHCVDAGPSGGDTCGTWCDNYCHLALTVCTDQDALFASDTDCQAACANLSDRGAAGDLDGDTVQCRLTHLALATSDTFHCGHAAETSSACQ